MIKIRIPKNYLFERRYIIKILFEEYLGIIYELIIDDTHDYKITLENGNTLIFKDYLFVDGDGLDYLKVKNIPNNVRIANNEFLSEPDLPVIYGEESMQCSDNEIVCSIDIFASSFFMLTRWEEYVVNERDSLRRFPAYSSLSYKAKFLNRAVVNEYTELLWNLLKKLGYNKERKVRKHEIFITHDVDHIYYWKNYYHLLRNLLLNIRNTKIQTAIKNFADYHLVKLGPKKDPYDTFDLLMDLSESVNMKSRFYFMTGGITKYDNNYKINEYKSLNLIKKIKNRGHIIGFHPSFNSYNNLDLWIKEKDLLENILGFEVKEGRQHYLRFENPTTWDIWNSSNMEISSTLGYPEIEGFRCGTCYEFSVFNILTRTQLTLKEYPLLAMEASLAVYQKKTPNIMENNIFKLINLTKKYNGIFVLLWHNSSFNSETWFAYQNVYHNLIKSYYK